MNCCGQPRTTGFWIKKGVLILLAVSAGIFIFGSVVMLLWNNILPALFGIKTITFWQALGILVLSKILFGGFRGCHGHHRFHGNGHHWHGKYMHLSPEERAKLKTEWRNRCCEPEPDQA
jgi:hypothetical protein